MNHRSKCCRLEGGRGLTIRELFEISFYCEYNSISIEVDEFQTIEPILRLSIFICNIPISNVLLYGKIQSSKLPLNHQVDTENNNGWWITKFQCPRFSIHTWSPFPMQGSIDPIVAINTQMTNKAKADPLFPFVF